MAIVDDAGKFSRCQEALDHTNTPRGFTHYFSADMDADEQIETELLADRPVVAVGAGATAAPRATSLLRTVPVYALIKLCHIQTSGFSEVWFGTSPKNCRKWTLQDARCC